MTFFAANPKTLKVEVITDRPPTGLQSYCYDFDNVKLRDIKQMLVILDLILGELQDVKIHLIPSPLGLKTSHVMLDIRNRKDIYLGNIQF